MDDDLIISRIKDALKHIRFGAIEIVIHDSKVVQIESREKIRFDQSEPKRHFKTIQKTG